MKTAGLDVSTCTGLAMVGDGEDRGKTIEVPKQRGFLRLQLIANDVSQTVQVWQPAFIAIESYAYAHNIRSFVTLVEIGTAIRITLRQMDLSWVEVNPTALKRWVTGKGNANKDQMAIAVKQRWGFQSPSHDIVDAYALAQMAQLGWDQVLNVQGVTIGWANAFFSQPAEHYSI